jgi:hypothetical protein
VKEDAKWICSAIFSLVGYEGIICSGFCVVFCAFLIMSFASHDFFHNSKDVVSDNYTLAHPIIL